MSLNKITTFIRCFVVYCATRIFNQVHQEFLNLSLALYKIWYLYTRGWGVTPTWKRQRCSSKILKLTPKGDQSELKIEFTLLNLLPKTLNETLKAKSILGFHVTSEKTKIKKKMSFYIRQLKDIFKHISAGLFSAW